MVLLFGCDKRTIQQPTETTSTVPRKLFTDFEELFSMSATDFCQPLTDVLRFAYMNDFFPDMRTSPRSEPKGDTAYSVANQVKSGEKEIGFIDLAPGQSFPIDDLHYQKLGRTAVVFYTNEANEASSITSVQVEEIYVKGESFDWQLLGGMVGEVVLPTRYQDGSNYADPATTALRSFLRLEKDSSLFHNARAEDLGITFDPYSAWLQKGPAVQKKGPDYALEYDLMGLVLAAYPTGEFPIRMLALDNTFPSNETVEAGEYIYSRDIFLVAKEESDLAKYLSRELTDGLGSLVPAMFILGIVQGAHSIAE